MGDTERATCEREPEESHEAVAPDCAEAVHPPSHQLEFARSGGTFDKLDDPGPLMDFFSSLPQGGKPSMAAGIGMVMLKNPAVREKIIAYAKGFPDVIKTMKDGIIHLWEKKPGGGQGKLIAEVTVAAHDKPQTVFEKIRAALEKWDARKPGLKREAEKAEQAETARQRIKALEKRALTKEWEKWLNEQGLNRDQQ